VDPWLRDVYIPHKKMMRLELVVRAHTYLMRTRISDDRQSGPLLLMYG